MTYVCCTVFCGKTRAGEPGRTDCTLLVAQSRPGEPGRTGTVLVGKMRDGELGLPKTITSGLCILIRLSVRNVFS